MSCPDSSHKISQIHKQSDRSVCVSNFQKLPQPQSPGPTVPGPTRRDVPVSRYVDPVTCGSRTDLSKQYRIQRARGRTSVRAYRQPPFSPPFSPSPQSRMLFRPSFIARYIAWSLSSAQLHRQGTSYSGSSAYRMLQIRRSTRISSF